MGYGASFGDSTGRAGAASAEITTKPHMEDLKKLLMASRQPGSANLHLAQAKCKLFPDKDPLSIYQEYGIEGGRE
jgi:hypothetical protein